MAEDLFVAHRADLAGALRRAAGGQNVIAAGLEADIDFAARLDALDVVGAVARRVRGSSEQDPRLALRCAAA